MVSSVSSAVLGEGVLRLLAAVSGGAEVLLILEDLQWADPETVQVLEYLIDNVGGQPVCCVATLRSDRPSPGLAAARALALRRSAVVVDVPRLGRSEVAEMARQCLDVVGLPAGLETLLERAEGSPFMVEELLAAAVGAETLRQDTDAWSYREGRARLVPQTLVDTVGQHFAALSHGDRNVVLAASLLGPRFDWTLLGPMLNRGDRSVLESLRRAADVQLVVLEADDFRFRHALTCDAVVGQLLGPERARLADAALVAIKRAHPGLPGRWCELAATLSEMAGEPSAAAGLLLVAARRALERGTLGTADGLLVRAADLVRPGTALRAEVDTLLLETAASAGDIGKAVEVGQRLLTTLLAIDAAAPLRAAAHLRIAEAAVAATDWRLAGQHVAAAAAAVEHTGEDVVLAQVGATAATVALGENRLDDAVRLARGALDGGRRTGHAEIVVAALEVIGRVSRLRDIAAARSVFVEQLAVAQDHGLTLWRLRALQQLGSLDVMTEGRFERLRAARELAHKAAALATAATIDLQMASNLSSSFEIQESLALAEQCADVARRWKLGLLLPNALIVIARNHAIAGRPGDMAAALDEAERTGGGDRDVAVGVLGCRALRWLLEEDRLRALGELAEAMALVGGHPAATQRPFFGLYPLVATLEGACGEEARTETRNATAVGVAVIEALIEYADAVAAGRSGDTDKAYAVFRAADAKFAPYQGRFAGWHQLGRRLVAEAALQDGWGDPVAWLTEAALFFRRGGLDVVEQACRSLLRRHGVRVPRRSYGHSSVPERLAALGVTDREAEVGALVREGLTNRDIARRLFISSRTVDKHIQRLMAKTGATTRIELGPLLDG